MDGMTVSQFATGIVTILVMNLMLGSDNAIAIGMTIRNLDPKVRKKGLIIGTIGAVVIRCVATIVVVRLLNIPYIMLIGGILLLIVGFKLVVRKDDAGSKIKTSETLFQAVMLIIAADFLMGLDNVLAVAGAANGNDLLVIIGLCLSIPITVFGSTLIVKLLDRFPFIIYVGAGVIYYTGAKMITEDSTVSSFFENRGDVFTYGFIIVVIAAGLLLSYFMKKRLDARAANPPRRIRQ